MHTKRLCRIVSRHQEHAVKQSFHCHCISRLQPHARSGKLYFIAHGHLVGQLAVLQRQNRRHELCRAGGGKLLVNIFGIENSSRIAVQKHGCRRRYKRFIHGRSRRKDHRTNTGYNQHNDKRDGNNTQQDFIFQEKFPPNIYHKATAPPSRIHESYYSIRDGKKKDIFPELQQFCKI